jgi:hypothetical protein
VPSEVLRTPAEGDPGSGDLHVAADTPAAPQLLSYGADCPNPRPIADQPQRLPATKVCLDGPRTDGWRPMGHSLWLSYPRQRRRSFQVESQGRLNALYFVALVVNRIWTSTNCNRNKKIGHHNGIKHTRAANRRSRHGNLANYTISGRPASAPDPVTVGAERCGQHSGVAVTEPPVSTASREHSARRAQAICTPLASGCLTIGSTDDIGVSGLARAGSAS